MKRFIDIHVPITACNFKCDYCYVTQMGKNNTERVEFKYSPEHVRKALSKERLGGACLFNVCGLGETLIPKEINKYLEALLAEGHYVMVVTNGTLTERFKEIERFDEGMRKCLFFKFSFHYLELKRLNKMEEFISNVNRIKNAGCSFTIEITPNDKLEPYIDEIKDICMKEFGALCHVTIPRMENDNVIPLLSKHSFEDFCLIWGTFKSELFDFKKSIWGVKRKEFCHAGEWSGLLNLGTGIWTPCYSIKAQKKNIFENIDKPIEFYPVGKCCKMPHCYNGHSYLTMGNIPEIDTYHFNQLRDRECVDGSHWLTPEVNEFFNGRLDAENSSNYSSKDKLIFTKYKYKTIIKNVAGKISSKITNK